MQYLTLAGKLAAQQRACWTPVPGRERQITTLRIASLEVLPEAQIASSDLLPTDVHRRGQ